MLVNLVIGHGKALLRISLGSERHPKEVVSAVDVEDSIMPLMLEVNEVAVELASSKLTEK